MTKEYIRSEYLNKRILFSESDDHPKLSKIISKNIVEYLNNNFKDSPSLSLYNSIKGEVSISRNLFTSFRLLYPRLIKVKNNIEIEFAEVKSDSSFTKSILGFSQPHDDLYSAIPDILIVPGVAFDKQCNRIGYGMGHYDKYLAKLAKIDKKIFTIGACFEFQLIEKISTMKHDVPMNLVITESNIYIP